MTSRAATDPVEDSIEGALRAAIRDVPDFPKPGIVFKDITPVLADPALFAAATRAMATPFADAGVTHVAAIESRGFIFGAPVAQHLGAGLIPLRKAGKLPWRTRRVEYALEYGSDVLEVHEDGFAGGARVLLVDDVLATGGTAAGAIQLIEGSGATVVGCSFLVGLDFLEGASRLAGHRTSILVRY